MPPMMLRQLGKRERAKLVKVTAAEAQRVAAVALQKAIMQRDAPLAVSEDFQPPRSSLDIAKRFRGFSMPVPEFHKVWYDAFDNGPTHLLLLAPRESGKTSAVLTAAEYRLLANRKTRVIIVSQTESLAAAFLREMVRDFTTNEALIRAVGLLKPERPAKWSETEIVLEGADLGKDVSVAALGVGGQTTGRRCDVLILDDVESFDSCLTELRRARTREWFAKEAMPTVAPGGCIWVIGTRKAESDLYGYIINAGMDLIEEAEAVTA